MQVATNKIRAPALRKMPAGTEYEEWSPSKRKKTKDNFLTFCDIVLAYTQYKSTTFKREEIRSQNNVSPLDSGVSTADSYTSDAALSSGGYAYTDEESPPNPTGQQSSHRGAAHQRGGHGEGVGGAADNIPADDDSWEAITCFCRKPFAGRPMIECSVCLTWLHLTCAKVRRSNIPEVFVCESCRNSHNTKPASRKKQRKSGGVSPRNNNFKPGSSYSRASPVSSESSQHSDSGPSEQYNSTSPASSTGGPVFTSVYSA